MFFLDDYKLKSAQWMVRHSMWGLREKSLERVYNSIRDAGIPLPEYDDYEDGISAISLFLAEDS